MMLLSCFWANFLATIVVILLFAAVFAALWLLLRASLMYEEWIEDNSKSKFLYMWVPLIVILMTIVPCLAAINLCP